MEYENGVDAANGWVADRLGVCDGVEALKWCDTDGVGAHGAFRGACIRDTVFAFLIIFRYRFF